MLNLQKFKIKMEEIKKKRGGKRDGAGRPKGEETTMISVRLEKELLKRIPSQTNRSKYVNDAVREKMAKDGLL